MKSDSGIAIDKDDLSNTIKTTIQSKRDHGRKAQNSNEEIDILDEFVRNNCQLVCLSQCTIYYINKKYKTC